MRGRLWHDVCYEGVGRVWAQGSHKVGDFFQVHKANSGRVPECDARKVARIPTLRRQVDHAIEVMPRVAPPAKAPYRMSREKVKKLKVQLEKLLAKGYIKPNQVNHHMGHPSFLFTRRMRCWRCVWIIKPSTKQRWKTDIPCLGLTSSSSTYTCMCRSKLYWACFLGRLPLPSSVFISCFAVFCSSSSHSFLVLVLGLASTSILWVYFQVYCRL